MRPLLRALAVLATPVLVACNRPSSALELAAAPVAQASRASPQLAERTVVRTGRMAVEVAALEPARERVLGLARSFDATVEQERREEKVITLRLRVPEPRLDAVMDSLAGRGRVIHRSTSAEDRSAAAVDLDARIKNLVASRDRLRGLYDRAANVTEVVAVERELSRVQGELDSLEAQLALLRGQAALSTFDLTLQQRLVLGPLGVVAQGATVLLTRLFIWR